MEEVLTYFVIYDITTTSVSGNKIFFQRRVYVDIGDILLAALYQAELDIHLHRVAVVECPFLYCACANARCGHIFTVYFIITQPCYI